MIDTQRNSYIRMLGPILLALLVLAIPATLLADEPESQERKSKIIVIGDGDEEMVIEMDEVQEIVAEAMSGLDEVMAELEEMQLQVRLGQDNRLDVSYDDTTFELDLDQVMDQVAVAVRAGLQNIHTEDWTHSYDRWDSSSDEDLRRELKSLKKEMKELARELRKLKELKDD